MESFHQLKMSTLCPFAKKAKVRLGAKWEASLPWEQNIEKHATDLLAFSEVAEDEKYHGYVAEIQLGMEAKSFDSVRKTFGQYLRSLALHDNSCRRSMTEDFMSSEWQFRYNNVRMFLNVFAPCYPTTHSKWIADAGSLFIFFQPDFSFDLCGIDSKKGSVKEAIRLAFSEAGMPYNGAQIDCRYEALLYMFPIDPFGAPVRWWED